VNDKPKQPPSEADESGAPALPPAGQDDADADDIDARLEAHPRFERMRPEDRLGEDESLVIFIPKLRRSKRTERP
jgi:hypothetical protein